MSHISPSPSLIATLARALAAGGTARVYGDGVTVDGHGTTIETTRDAYEAAVARLQMNEGGKV